MTRKTNFGRFLVLTLIVAVCASFMATPVFARSSSAVKTDPYGFTWLDEEEDIWYIQYYEYSSRDGAYSITDYVYVDNNKLYDKNGKQINTVKSMDSEDEPTAGFYNGKLYFLDKSGYTCQMSKSTDSKYSRYDSNSAKYFTLDEDGLITKAGNYSISSMKFSGSYSRNSSSNGSGNHTEKSGDYVKTYAYNGDPEKTVYDAYYDDELLISIYCKGSNVWVDTNSLLLSETCVGAKFVGYAHGYFTIMYDLDGTIYCFAYDRFNKALPITFNEEIMSYVKDDDGFIESIKTNRRTYDLDDLIEEYGYDRYAYEGRNNSYDDDEEITSVKNSNSSSTAYYYKNEVVSVLKKSSNYLYWNNEKMENSYKATYLGITQDNIPVWINDDGELWYYNGSREKMIDDDVTRLQYDNNGFAYRYFIGNRDYTINVR